MSTTPLITSPGINAFSSEFLPGQRFGKYPTLGEARVLENNGITIFVDLTEEREELPTYPLRNARHISFPIPDRDVPKDIEAYISFITEVIKLIGEEQRLYIHCRGGHGRSGTVVATILAFYSLYDRLSSTLSPCMTGEKEMDADKATEEGLLLTKIAHGQRRVMKEKFRRMGAPQTGKQRLFVYGIVRYASDRW